MRLQRSILRKEQTKQFVLVSLVMFKDVALVIKLASVEWWSYMYSTTSWLKRTL